MGDSKKDEEERRSGAVLPLGGGGAGAGPGGWGGWLNALARAMAVSPEAALLRIFGGAAVGVCALAVTATLYGRATAAGGGPLAVSFDRRPGEAQVEAHPPMENFVRGMAGLWGPVLGLSDAPAAEPAPPDAPKGAAEGEAGKADQDSAEKGKKDGAGAAEGDAAARAAAAEAAAAGASGPGVGGGGSGSGALASDALAGAAGAAGAGKAGAGALPDGADTGAPASKRDMRAGALRSARPASGKAGSGALNQLKFAQNRSALGAMSAAPERSYGAAQSAFEGGAPGAAGGGIGGAGASQGGAGVGSVPASPRYGPTGPMNPDSKRLSCPSGYSLDGSDCKPLEGVNKTPYQGLADMAKAFLIAAAALALVGLILVTQPTPWMQALGGILLGAAAGLIIAALAIGADIQNRYGQKKQADAIGSAAGRAGQGKSP
ncbi:hypothetical protein EPO15_11335 [bacterium]|nr:MAG: hypothetical protein EPO15_11335 [bacterium]